MRIGTASNAEIHFPADREPTVADQHATLHRSGHTYAVYVDPGQVVFVNGRQVMSETLSPGDVLQLGDCGPLLRVRVRGGAARPYKSVSEALSDCVDCARYGKRAPFSRATAFLAAMPRELVTQTAPVVRWGLVSLLLLLTGVAAALTWHSVRLEQRLAGEGVRLQETQDRLAALEARVGAGKRIVSAATESVVFLQLSVRFVEPKSGKEVRLLGLNPDGSPVSDPLGQPLLTLESEGPVFEQFFTGTAFVASNDGLLLTNRHVARPWEEDAVSQAL
ncbi:MAG: FHA domain-containing protein, partial [Acidiferrobacterales bacterium]